MKIGSDTNILVRYLTNDDPEQADKVEKLFSSMRKGDTLVINDIVVAELDWVLTSVYKYSKEEFLKAVNQLFETHCITFNSPLLVKKACEMYANSNADFSDCYLGVTNLNSGCETTYTFDKKAAKLSSFTLL